MLGQITYLSYKIAITDVIATSEAAREALTHGGSEITKSKQES
jgi:hypothetical protein